MTLQIENSSQYGYFTIRYNDKVLGCYPDEKEIIKINDNGGGGSQKGISHFSKEQIKDFSIIILSGYIYSHKEMTKMVGDEKSEQDLFDQKRLILLMRSVLETLTNFIDEYDANVLDRFREI